ncbi:acyl-CoA dehydrogenase [Acrocarpospora pleiomorpha]|uniref:Acyl-CoA dehydrogenase n=1 Tax=Acrocarpospora pleiomorpha TaxID=90975 RepID=A0A5M3XS65_9ACTN|nr:acyl-CoA dehydrogenase family protein [Acrocarpospora pleiomorpha]GES23892.1 acyl-CoA dehydrogenase [Acrocarpospora pleiomorpha]
MYPLLSTDETTDLARWTEESQRELAAFASQHRAELDAANAAGRFPRDLYLEFGRRGYLAPFVPKEYGGLGGGIAEYAVIAEEVGRHGLVSGQIAAQGERWLLDWGTSEQKDEWLAAISSGEKIFSESISEKNAGSSFKTMKATATRAGSDWIINAQKTHVNMGADSDVTLVYAIAEEGLTSFLVDASLPGVERRQTDPVGLRLVPTADMSFIDVRIPASAILGEPGGGLQTFLSTFNVSRLGNASELIGLGRRAMAHAVEYAKQRIVGESVVTSFQGIQWMIADAWQALAAASLARDNAVLTYERTGSVALETSLAKRLAIDAAELASTSAYSIVGGHGLYFDQPYTAILNDIKVLKVAGGSSEILRNYIATRVLKHNALEGIA